MKLHMQRLAIVASCAASVLALSAGQGWAGPCAGATNNVNGVGSATGNGRPGPCTNNNVVGDGSLRDNAIPILGSIVTGNNVVGNGSGNTNPGGLINNNIYGSNSGNNNLL